MYRWLVKILTKNHNEIPLFNVTFNLNKYRKYGSENSCNLRLHPDLENDTYVKKTLEDLVDHIRRTKNMENLVR